MSRSPRSERRAEQRSAHVRARATRWALASGLASTVIAISLAFLAARGSADAPRIAAQVPTQRIAPHRPAPRTPRSIPRALLEGFDPLVHRVEGQHAFAELGGGRRAQLTLEPELQTSVARLLQTYAVPWAAVVVLEPRSGKVLAYVSHSSANPDAGDLVLDPTPPAASVFKVITSAALIDRGVRADARVCYGGGESRLVERDLSDDPARDHRCATLTEAMGGSINAVFAKLADRRLDVATLDRYAGAFGFGHALPFDVPTRPSPAEIPEGRLEFARTAAGFWHMHMSPLHAALIASTIANGGEMPRAYLVDRVLDAEGHVLAENEPQTFRSVIPASTAEAVNRMMRHTVTHGTARRAFHDERGAPFFPGVSVAGKTGTLNGSDPFRAYTWWVGFAPADRPRFAVAALVVNTPIWRIKASFVARETLRFAFRSR